MRKKYVLGSFVTKTLGTVAGAAIGNILGGGKKGAGTTTSGSGGNGFVEAYRLTEEGARERGMELQQIPQRSQDNSMGELASEILGNYLEDIPAKDREIAQKELNKFFIG